MRKGSRNTHMKPYPIEKAFMLIEPGPVLFVSTSWQGKHNIMTMSWHMLMEFTPRIACTIGPWDYSYHALRRSGECVIAVPTVDMINKVTGIGNLSGKDIDKFTQFRLTPLQGKTVSAPLIEECLANIECIVRKKPSGKGPYTFELEGIKAWYNPDRKEKRTLHAKGDGTFHVQGRKIIPRVKMLKIPDYLK